MTSRDFCYWLQGYFEVSQCNQIHPHQVESIQKHLNLVFTHEIDPSMGDAEHQAKLNKIHKAQASEVPIEEYWTKIHGPQPHEGWEVGLHGWYDPKQGIPRC
jgi:hypothetical protein